MKKLIVLCATLGAFALSPIHQASAHDRCRDGRLVGYTPCGKPIYSYHEVVGRDHCGRNVWEWVTKYPSSCHCRDARRDHDRCDSHPGFYRPGGWSFHIRF